MLLASCKRGVNTALEIDRTNEAKDRVRKIKILGSSILFL
jgi:hypothetical protein